MKFFSKHLELALSVEQKRRGDIVQRAKEALATNPPRITDSRSPDSAGGPHDYFSQADYCWPNPNTPDGRPFVHRDGESYPGAFFDHRKALRSMRSGTANLTAAYLFTGDTTYAKAAVRRLKEFFLDNETLMNPNLLYSQAIMGVDTGRSIGIIDTIHLMDVPVAADRLFERGQMEQAVYDGLKSWFAEYVNWICTHPYGVDEMNMKNNHAVCWLAQAAAFAKFTGNGRVLNLCAERYKSVILPNQMAQDGSFPQELHRTKPYGYSIFIVDSMATVCRLLSTAEDNLWEFTLPDGRGMKKGLDYLYPYLHDKNSWTYKPDIACHDEWPVAMSFMLFAAAAYGESRWSELYDRLPTYSHDDEVRRNTAIRVPYLWL